MCYTGMCKNESWNGDCLVGPAERRKYCYLHDDDDVVDAENPDKEDEDAE